MHRILGRLSAHGPGAACAGAGRLVLTDRPATRNEKLWGARRARTFRWPESSSWGALAGTLSCAVSRVLLYANALGLGPGLRGGRCQAFGAPVKDGRHEEGRDGQPRKAGP